MNIAFKDSYDFINKLRMIAYGLLSLPLAVFALIYLRSNKGENLQPYFSQPATETLTIVFMFLWIVSVVASYLIFRRKLRSIRQIGNLKNRFLTYFQASLLKFGLLEAALIFCVVGFVLTANKIFAGSFVAAVFVFSVENPSIYKVIRQLRLSPDEKKFINERREF